jgi:hypothetical protein
MPATSVPKTTVEWLQPRPFLSSGSRPIYGNGSRETPRMPRRRTPRSPTLTPEGVRRPHCPGVKARGLSREAEENHQAPGKRKHLCVRNLPNAFTELGPGHRPTAPQCHCPLRRLGSASGACRCRPPQEVDAYRDEQGQHGDAGDEIEPSAVGDLRPGDRNTARVVRDQRCP